MTAPQRPNSIQRIAEGGPQDVVLVLMPYVALEHGSIGLGLLKAQLTQAGFRCLVDYACLRFAEEVGLDSYLVVELGSRLDLVGEWTFAGSAFPDFEPDVSEVLARAGKQLTSWLIGPRAKPRHAEALVKEYRRLRSLAPGFVDRTARAILATGAKVVGCSSTFEQHAASLALLRRIRELDPAVVTLLGGANCEGEMGVASVREFPWVDFTFSGEADDAIVPLTRLCLEHGRHIPTHLLPNGTLNRERARQFTQKPRPADIPRNSIQNMDSVPDPDYSDYFAALERSPLAGRITPGLLAETSRGCWWGAKKHCTFCGLNGGGMFYRSKSAEGALGQFQRLSETYGIRNIEVVDNILDMGYFKTVLPKLADSKPGYGLFFETKANLRRDHVELLSRAGVRFIQPGIEGLHDGVLKLMNKGTTARINLQLLKYSAEFGIRVAWTLLTGFPGEKDDWHTETAGWLPLVHHLPPPSTVVRIRFDRFSVYHENPAAYGLDLVPFDAYSNVYPVSQETLAQLAYFFRNRNEENSPRGTRSSNDPSPAAPGFNALKEAATLWTKSHAGPIPCIFCFTDHGDRIELFDTRPCAPVRRSALSGFEADVHRCCEPAATRGDLLERLALKTGAPVPEERLEETLASLKKRMILLEIHGHLWSLAVAGSIPPMPTQQTFPGGYVGRPALQSILQRHRDPAHT